MLVEKQAVCPYCGKQRFVNVENSVSEDELNQMAGETCDCAAAKMARGMKQTDSALDALLGPESREKGFDYEVDEDTVRYIRMICKITAEHPATMSSSLGSTGATIPTSRRLTTAAT